MNYLIADLNIRMDGHKYGFVQNIIDFLAQRTYGHNFTFLVNRSQEFSLKDPQRPGISIKYLGESEQIAFETETRLLKRSAIQWEIITDYCDKLNIDQLILMELDLYQVAMGKKNTPFKVSGIWFRPHVRFVSGSHSIITMVRHRFWMLQKELLIRAALRNKSLEKVFILNDEKVAAQMSKKYGSRFFHLPDPVFDYAPAAGYDVRKKYGIEQERVIFLVFGYIDERKNVLNIIRAMNALEDKDAAKVSLLIIGKFEPGFQDRIEKELKPDYKYQLAMHDSFVSDGEMEAIFCQSDVILRMNVNFFGSSGIIGIAAKYNKPSMVSGSGIMAELTEAYRLGVLVNPEAVSEIKEKVLYYLESLENRQTDGQDYYKSHGVEAYVNTLLDLA